mgnify:CR=1 FL=1
MATALQTTPSATVTRTAPEPAAVRVQREVGGGDQAEREVPGAVAGERGPLPERRVRGGLANLVGAHHEHQLSTAGEDRIDPRLDRRPQRHHRIERHLARQVGCEHQQQSQHPECHTANPHRHGKAPENGGLCLRHTEAPEAAPYNPPDAHDRAPGRPLDGGRLRSWGAQHRQYGGDRRKL